MGARPFLPIEDLAIIGGWAIDMSCEEIGDVIDRQGESVKQRVCKLRKQGYPMHLRRRAAVGQQPQCDPSSDDAFLKAMAGKSYEDIAA